MSSTYFIDNTTPIVSAWLNDVNASAAVICTGTSVTSAGGLLATGTITFSATYFV